MKRAWVWIALLLSLGVNIGILATVGAGRYRGMARFDRSRFEGPPPFARMADHLDLEGEAREQFLKIQQELFQTTRHHRDELEELRGELRREVTLESPDLARVERLLAESGEVNRDLDRAMVESVLATRRVLTPEQLDRFFHVVDRLRPVDRRLGPHGRPPGRRRPRTDPPDPSK